jgi:hypothetical protein
MNRTLMFLATTYCCTAAFGADVVSASLDLRTFGYRLSRLTSKFADISDLSFISDDLLVITVNQWNFEDMKTARADTPESTVVVFDAKRASIMTTGKMAVEKSVGESVQAISGERFAVLDEKGLQFCNANLRCEPITPTIGPMFVSPQGKRVAVGGNGLTAQTVIDTESLKQVAVFEHAQMGQHAPVPGDGATLVDRNGRIMVQRSGVGDVLLNIPDTWDFREFRFLSPGSVACLEDGASEAVIFDTDGKQIRRYKVAEAERTGFLPTASGTRFGIYEHGYTRLNSAVNFLDFDGGRPENFQRVRVIDPSSGDEISRFEWDPQSRAIKPAISPDGHRIARVKGGVLEVLQVN